MHVTHFIAENFLPVRVHVKDQASEYKRLGEKYGVQWTPTVLVLDPEGGERHRIEGFLPVDEFLPQLALGQAKVAFARGNFDDAERRYREIVKRHPSSETAAEALYWAGVSRYKGTGEAKALGETAKAFTEQYQESVWAKKASVWG